VERGPAPARLELRQARPNTGWSGPESFA
jgi:hypothetical protein